MAIQGFKYTLSWDTDFTPVDDAPEGFKDRSARTKASVTLDPGLRGTKDAGGTEYYFMPATVKVIVKAVKAESWVIKDKKTDKLLKHEQMHYNISALAGRDLERKILALRDTTPKDLIKKKDDLGTETQALIDKINKEYDAELHGTNHGAKDTEQTKWELHLTNLMNDPKGELKGV